MVLDAAVSVGDLQACVRAEAGEALQDIYVFDVYTGKGVPKGRKSIAFGLILQDLSRTLTDQEVEQIVRRIVSRCERDLGATLRI
jgi:phenylalanyl-tRNA synthetase beta chain